MELSNMPLLDLTKDERKWTALAVAAGGVALLLFDAAKTALAAGDYVSAAALAVAAALAGALAVWTTIPDEQPDRI